jgi:hypothetical protein
MKQFYVVQQYPYEDWETIAQFENESDANEMLAKLKEAHSKLANQYNNYKVKAVADNAFNRQYHTVYAKVCV